MKILALTCTHNRNETVDIFLHHMNYDLLIVDSIGGNTEEYDNGRDIWVIKYDNDQLGAKWNYGLQHAKHIDFDYLLITGSDDIFSPGLIESLAEQDADYAGLLDFYFYDIEKDLLKYCSGLQFNRKGEPHGAGRIIKRWVLEALEWHLWDDNINYGLDASMTRKFLTVNLNTFFTHIPKGMYAVDLKSSDNIHSIHEYNGVWMNKEEKQQLRDHFNLQYV